MSHDELTDRITEQFSDQPRRSDIWRAFDVILDTSAYLNLGYSPSFYPMLVGSSQRRLVTKVGSLVQSHTSSSADDFLLDVGCGRGGPARDIATHVGFTVVGVDLVPYNVRCARRTMRPPGDAARFVIGDAERLPIATGTMHAAVAIDSIVYFPRKSMVFGELARVLDSAGVVVFSDLVSHSSVTPSERRALDRFSDAWDMPQLQSLDAYEHDLVSGGFEITSIIDITPNSIGRFRKWTHCYRLLAATPVNRLLEWVLRRNDVHPDVIHDQILHAHHALPSLRHVLVVAHPA